MGKGIVKNFCVKEALASVNWKLYRALLLMGLCPTIYTTVRTFFIGQMPNEWAYSIAGQLSWVNLLYEIATEAIILPLFYFLGKAVGDRDEFINRIKTGLLFSDTLYLLFAIFLISFDMPLLRFMAVSPDILDESSVYIRLESIAFIFSVLFSYMLVALVTLNKAKIVYVLTFFRTVITILLDIFMISQFSFSLRLGINGIAVSNIITNIVLFVVGIFILKKEGYNILTKTNLSFMWMKQFAQVGAVSGLESLIRNLAYMLMIVRMVNVVSEQGTYWVANNFIWGWLLLPVIQLAEVIKQEVSVDLNAVKNKSSGWFALTGIICMGWILCIPLYKPFMKNVLGYTDVDKLFQLVMVLLIFYILYAFQNVFDAVFYGAGKTKYMLFESVVTNTVYYGTAFILFKAGLWVPSLINIALLFGFGNAFDAVVSWIAYRYFLRRYFTAIQMS